MQAGSPVASKPSRPRLTHIVERPRLFARLDAMRELPMIWVSGPPGAGKSALLASYLDYREAPSLWCRADASNTDLASCFDLLTRAAGQRGDSAASLPVFQREDLADVAAFARKFFRALFAHSSAGTVLVVDNFERAPNLASLLREALEEVPPGMSIMVASRTPPPPALARFVAHGQLGEIDWHELSLTEEESAEIAAAHGVQDHAVASTLHRYCDGWAAGLVIALAGHQRGCPVPSPSVTDLLHDYFATEVLDGLTEPARTVLLATAHLPAFTPSMASIVAGFDASSTLGDLRHRFCFIARAESSELYRCHGLFREFLMDRLVRDLSANQVQQMRRTCARVLDEAGQIDAAIDLYSKVGDIGDVKRLVALHADALFRSGQSSLLARWISLFRSEELESDGWLMYWHAVVLLPTSPAGAQEQFGHVYRMFAGDGLPPHPALSHEGRGGNAAHLSALPQEERGDIAPHPALSEERRADIAPHTSTLPQVERGTEEGKFMAALGAVEAILARVDCYQDLDEWIRVLEPHMNRAEEIAEHSVRARAWYAFLQATLIRRPDHRLIPLGVAWLREGLQGGRFSASDTVSAGTVLLFYACVAADDVVAHETVAASAEAANRDDLPPVARWGWHYWYGLFWLWRLQYEHAVQCWEHCTRISAQCGLSALDWLVHGNLVMVDLAEDRLELAERRLAELWRAGNSGHMNAYALYWMGETFLRLYRQRDDLPQAIAAMVECGRNTGYFNLEMLCLSDAAAVYLLRDADDAAAALVDEVGGRLAGTVVKQCEGQVVALRAGLLYRAGQMEQAHRTFAEALDWVTKGGSCGCMLWVRAGLSTLFEAALQTSRYAPVVRDLVRRYQVPPPARAGSEWPWPVRIHALGHLQIEVDDAPLPSGPKAQQKVLDLLKALIAEGGRQVDAGTIADWLWPDVDGDAAQSNLRGTVKRLRELLGHPESVRLFDGKISLNERICWLDLWAFREWCAALLEGTVTDGHHAESTRHLQSLYRGPFLNGEDAAWLRPARRRERLRIGRVLARLSSHDESVASRLRDHALLVDPELAAA